MGAIRALHYSHETSAANYPKPTVKPSKYIGINSVYTVPSGFHPIYHTTNLIQLCLLSDKLREKILWYNEVDINSIGKIGYHKPMSIDNEVYN